MAGPDVRYALSGGVNIAYQVVGDGPHDLIFVCGTMSHLELWWSDPDATAMIERLAEFARVILFDKPGTGLSDPVPASPTAEQRATDITAVLDAVGSQRAIVVGYSEGGYPSMLVAATQPERVEALVLVATMVTTEHDPAYPVSREPFDAFWTSIDQATERWGEGLLLEAMSPTWAAHPVYRRLLGSIERSCMSPGMARSVLQGLHDIDLREIVESIHVPTLVLHAQETFVAQEFGRDLASRIPGAAFRQLDGPDHLMWIHNAQLVPDAIEELVTGVARAPRDDGRVLTTIVFTDIVDSTRQLSQIGDARWRALLAEHDRRVDQLLVRHDGVPVKHTGDGRLAQFARPARAVRFASAMVESAREGGLEIRAGVHTGEVEVVSGDLIGLAVNIGARITAIAKPGDVLVSSTVRDLVIGSGLGFEPWGEHDLKGAPGRWALYRAVRDRPGALHPVGYETDVREEATPQQLERSEQPSDRLLMSAARAAPGMMRWALRVSDRRKRPDRG